MATWTKISDWLTEDSQAYSAGKTPLVVAGNLQISLETRELIVEGKSMLLTEDEVDLLMFLTKHPKHFVSPHTSLSTRWNESRTGKSEFLRVLCSLQRKLEAAGVKRRYIRVEPWYLYSFDPTP